MIEAIRLDTEANPELYKAENRELIELTLQQIRIVTGRWYEKQAKTEVHILNQRRMWRKELIAYSTAYIEKWLIPKIEPPQIYHPKTSRPGKHEESDLRDIRKVFGNGS